MKKWGIAIILIMVLIAAIFVGIYLFKNINEKNKESQYNHIENNTIVNEIDYSTKNNITIQTNIKQEKISPNATLILKKHYTNCNHILKEYSEIPEEFVNLTQEELEKENPNWKIEKFTPLDVTLIKEVDGFCNEHYILKEENKVIVVYKINESGKEDLYDTTSIAIEYLTPHDQEKIKQGIRIYGNEELNSLLEDYE